MNLKNIKDKKNQLLIIPSAEKEESKQEINNNLLISGPMKIDNIETPKSSLLTNSLTVENEFNSNTSNQNQVSILEANNLEDNSLIKQKNYLINLLFFVFGGFFFLIIPKFIKKKKDLLRKSSTKKGETNEKYLSQEFHSLNKLISQKTEHMNNLYLEKEIIENQIESIKYDLKYHEIQKTNLKVYTLTKYKELFPSKLDGIENMKFNGLVSNNINNTYSISKYNPYDMKSYKFIKNT